jgi:hypothetical protein
MGGGIAWRGSIILGQVTMMEKHWSKATRIGGEERGPAVAVSFSLCLRTGSKDCFKEKERKKAPRKSGEAPELLWQMVGRLIPAWGQQHAVTLWGFSAHLTILQSLNLFLCLCPQLSWAGEAVGLLLPIPQPLTAQPTHAPLPFSLAWLLAAHF